MRPVLPGAEGMGFRCDFCRSVFPDLESLQQHVLAAHAGRPSPPLCPHCGRSFDSSAALRAHLVTSHAAGSP